MIDGHDIIISHTLPKNLAYELVLAYFEELWSDSVRMLDNCDDGQIASFIYENKQVRDRIESPKMAPFRMQGVESEPGFVHVISRKNELTVVVDALDEFGNQCKTDLTEILRVTDEVFKRVEVEQVGIDGDIYLGEITVDSGRLLIIDPAYIKHLDATGIEKLPIGTIQIKEAGKGLLVSISDGKLPVIREMVNSKPANIVIES